MKNNPFKIDYSKYRLVLRYTPPERHLTFYQRPRIKKAAPPRTAYKSFNRAEYKPLNPLQRYE